MGHAGSGDYTHFILNTANSSAGGVAGTNVEVPANGTGVLDVYYDRDLVTYQFTFPAVSASTVKSAETVIEYLYSDGRSNGTTEDNSRNGTNQRVVEYIETVTRPASYPGDAVEGQDPNVRKYTALYGQNFEQAGYGANAWPENYQVQTEVIVTTYRRTDTRTYSYGRWRDYTNGTPDSQGSTDPTPGTPKDGYVRAWYDGSINSSFKDAFTENKNYSVYNPNSQVEGKVPIYLYTEDLDGAWSLTHETSDLATGNKKDFNLAVKLSGFTPASYRISRVNPSNGTTEDDHAHGNLPQDDYPQGDIYGTMRQRLIVWFPES